MERPSADLDREMMTHCIALSRSSSAAGEYPYGAVIARNGQVVAESINQVKHDGDVTRHAEVVAISAAQKALGSVSLDECTIYVNAEPCAFCCYAIRESRIRRVVYGLYSPHMGGVSKWNILADEDLWRTVPEVFAPPPEIVAGFMAKEAEQALFDCHPLATEIIKARGIFDTVAPAGGPIAPESKPRRRGLLYRVMRFLRHEVFDRFGR